MSCRAGRVFGHLRLEELTDSDDRSHASNGGAWISSGGRLAL